jgi:hypothetical protein
MGTEKKSGRIEMLVSLAWVVLLLSALILWFRAGYDYGQNTDQWTHSLTMSCGACLFLVAAAFANKHFQ